MKKATWIFSIWVSFLSAVFFFLYGYTGLTIGWMSFIVLAVYFGMGSKTKDILAVLCSITVGLIWGQLDFVFDALLTSIGIPGTAAMFISITIMTTITMGLHLVILENTLFNKLPFIFACVALTFSQGGKNEAALAFTLIAGLLLALVCSLGESYIFSHFVQQPKSQKGMSEFNLKN